MSEQTYTITRALTRVKTLSAQLEELGSTGSKNIIKYIGTVLESRKETELTKNYIKDAEANFNSFNDLFKELAAIKNAIKLSNSQTKISLNGETLTVSEAITLKEIINVKRNFYRELLSQYERCTRSVESAENDIEEKARRAVEKISNENTSTGEAYTNLLDAARVSVIKDTRLTIVGITNVEKLREEYNKIETFFEEIDFKLSESNAVTTITL